MSISKNQFFNFLLFVSVSCLLCLMSACKNEKDNFTFDSLYEYAPVDSAHYVIYDVDSITYGNTRDTAHYQLMEMVGDTFYDGENEVNYELNLFRRANATAPWSFDRKWFVKRTATNFQKTDDDARFIKLIFPPTADAEWNGNLYVATTSAFQVYEDWDYKYTSVNEPYSINGFSFDSTIVVSEVDNENLIEKTLRKEVYAKHVGMIYQEWEVLTKNVPDNWETGPKTGFRIRMKVFEHN